MIEQEDVNDKILAQAYEKLILSHFIVISTSEICIKLKHIMQIATLMNDKLSIESDLFVVGKVNENICLVSVNKISDTF